MAARFTEILVKLVKTTLGLFHLLLAVAVASRASHLAATEDWLGTSPVTPLDVLLRRPGSSVVLPCNVTQNESRSFTILWLHDDRQITTFTSENARGSSLLIERLKWADAGFYRCLLLLSEDKPSLIYSAKLDLEEPPSFVILPQHNFASVGQNIRFECAVRGSPMPTISWYQNHTQIISSIEDDNRFLILPTSVLQIRNFTPSLDSGVYTCKANNFLGNISAETLLSTSSSHEATIKANELFLAKPQNFTAKLGDDVLLECFPNFSSRIKFRWERTDGRPFPPGDRTKLLGSNLLLRSVGQFDSGFYACVLQFETNRTISRALAQLTVHYEPKIVTSSNDVKKPVGDSVRLNCLVDSYATATVLWFKGVEPVNSFGRIKIMEPEVLETPSGFDSNLFKNDLVISSLRVKDAGVYHCIVFNQYGQTSKSMLLEVIHAETYASETPKNLWAVVSQEDRLVRLHWNAGGSRATVYAFMIHYHTDIGEENDPENTESLTPEESCDKNGSCKAECCSQFNLLPATRYIFWVSAVMRNGLHTPHSNEIQIYTWDETALSVVVPLTVRHCSHFSGVLANKEPSACVKLWFEKPQKSEARGLVIEYRVEYKQAAEEEAIFQAFIPPTISQHFFTDLKPDTFYDFRVVPRTRGGYPGENSLARTREFPWVRFKTNGGRTLPLVDHSIKNLALDLEHFWSNSSSLLVFLYAGNKRAANDSQLRCSVSLCEAEPYAVISSKPVELNYGRNETNLPHVVFNVQELSKFYQISFACFKLVHDATTYSSYSSAVSKLIRYEPPVVNKIANKVSRPVVEEAVRWPVPPVQDVECFLDSNSQKFGVRWNQPGGDLIVSHFLVRYGVQNGIDLFRFINTTKEHITFKNLDRNRSYSFSIQTVSRDNKRSKFSEDLLCFLPTDLSDYPLSPLSPEASSIDNSTIFVTWAEPVQNFDSTLAHYVVRYRKVDTTRWNEIMAEDNSNSLVISELTPGQTYEIAVLTEGSVGRRSRPSSPIRLKLGDEDSTIEAPSVGNSEKVGQVVVERVSYVEGIIVGFCIASTTILLCIFILMRKTKASANRTNCSLWRRSLTFLLSGRRLSTTADVRKTTQASLLAETQRSVPSDFSVAVPHTTDGELPGDENPWLQMKIFCATRSVKQDLDDEVTEVVCQPTTKSHACDIRFSHVQNPLLVVAYPPSNINDDCSADIASPMLNSDSDYSTASRSRNSDSASSSSWCHRDVTCGKSDVDSQVAYSKTLFSGLKCKN